MIGRQTSQPRWVDEYEAIRSQALGQRPAGQPLGMAVFLRQGMVAWMKCWKELTPLPALTRIGRENSDATDPSIHPDLPLLLANLAFRHLEEATAK